MLLSYYYYLKLNLYISVYKSIKAFAVCSLSDVSFFFITLKIIDVEKN